MYIMSFGGQASSKLGGNHSTTAKGRVANDSYIHDSYIDEWENPVLNLQAVLFVNITKDEVDSVLLKCFFSSCSVILRIINFWLP